MLRMSSAAAIRRFGQHLTWIQEPDIFFMRLEGTLTGPQLQSILEWQDEWGSTKTQYFVLSDLSQLGTMSRDARKIMNDRQNVPPGLVMSISYGGSFTVRVLADMSFRARKALGIQETSPTIFVATEADAVAEVEKYRNRS